MKEERKAGLKFLFLVVVKEVLNCDAQFCHSLDTGFRGRFLTKHRVTTNDIKIITQKIYEYIEQDYPILKLNVTNKDAINYCERYGETEKANTIKNVINETVVFNELLGNYNYFYSNTVNRTKEICDFKIINLGNNDFVIIDNYKEKRPYVHKKNIFNEFERYNNWLNNQNIRFVTDLNKVISDGKVEDFIKKNDIMINDSIMKIAQDIVRLKKQIILLGGPTSSGKTTSSKKLALFLNALGKNTIKISLDNYYKELEEIPVDENGKRDFESIKALDLSLFRKQLIDLINGKSVVLPTYIFQIASKKFETDPIVMGKNDIILVEGLHSLNEVVSKNIEKRYKYKVYVSPFTPLTLDRHNYISTTENRLLRRIVRDNRTRGVSVEKTLAVWQDVRNSEELNVFPYTNDADVVLNTSYIYEIGVLKVYAEPLLYTVKIDSPYYDMARRLLENLRVFFPISSEFLASDNVLREFIGNSEYNEG